MVIEQLSTLVRSILDSTPVPEEPFSKMMGYFKTIVQAERKKSQSIEILHSLPLPIKKLSDSFTMRVSDYPALKQSLLTNSRAKYPRDLYLGLCLNIQGHSKAFLGKPINFEALLPDILEKGEIELNLGDLDFATFERDAVFLSGDDKQLISKRMVNNSTIESLQDIVWEVLDRAYLIEPNIQIGLCNQNISLSLLETELDRIKIGNIRFGTVMSAFLGLDKLTNSGKGNPYILKVTSLDKSQSEIISAALTHPLTVITGAPGTGKTQVILNILANAIIRGEKVLIASKNNKAVDNVKQRFDSIDGIGSLFRLGSKDVIAAQTIPSLKNMLTQVDNFLKTINKYDYRKEKNQLIKLNSQLESEQNKLKVVTFQKGKLKIAVSTLKEQLEKINEKFQDQLEHSLQHNVWLLSQECPSKESLTTALHRAIRLQRELGKYDSTFYFFIKFLHFQKDLEKAIHFYESIAVWFKELNRDLSTPQFSKPMDLWLFYRSIILTLDSASKAVDKKQLLEVIHYKRMKQLDKKFSSLQSAMDANNEEAERIEKHIYQLQNAIDTVQKRLDSLSNSILLQSIKSRWHELDNFKKSISNYISCLEARIDGKAISQYDFLKATESLQSFICGVALTSLSAKNCLKFDSEIFDTLIIDEASQCDIVSAIPLIFRAKKVIIIGDPLQLPHIPSISLSEELAIKDHYNLTDTMDFSYVKDSLWDYSVKILAKSEINNQPLIIENHYRCHPDIFGYSNSFFYQQRFGRPLKVKTDISFMANPEPGLKLIDVKGHQPRPEENLNPEEAEKSLQIACDLAYAYPNLSIGIVSPFRDQTNYINSRIPLSLKERVICDTVHRYQGDEKDVMILTTVVSKGSPLYKIRWIDRDAANLLNVAVTRARQVLYVVADVDFIRRNSCRNRPLGYLISYAKGCIRRSSPQINH